MKTGVFSRKQLTALCVMGAMFVGTLGAGTAMALAAADDQTLQTETVSLTEELGKVSFVVRFGEDESEAVRSDRLDGVRKA